MGGGRDRRAPKLGVALSAAEGSLSNPFMAYDWLKGVADEYDVIVIGSGLGGLTGANVLAKAGHRVLLLEHHYQFGGLATWFTRKGGHIFDISLHGFPVGMIKSCRKYWTREIADSIVQLRDIRFVNPQMDVWTTFTREDYTRVLVEQFGLAREHVERFYDYLRGMNFYDNNPETTGEMLERFFPGRSDVKRLLMEPIAYANGSTLDDPAITFGIVFSNFMGSGVYTFRGGSDLLVEKMVAELRRNGVELRKKVLVERILVEERDGRKVAAGIVASSGRVIRAKAVLSNANIKTRSSGWQARRTFRPTISLLPGPCAINSSSCQVYFGIRRGRNHSAYRRPHLHIGRAAVQQRGTDRRSRPAAARFQSIIRTRAPAPIAIPSSPRSMASI